MNNPHDKFFKSLFSRKQEVIEFVKGAFPEKMLNKIDFDSFQIDPNSYVDKHLHEHFSDFVSNCHYGNRQIKIALLFEHKSTMPPYPHFQLLQYFVNIQEKQIKQNNRPVPVIPVVIYHGYKSWNYIPLDKYFTGIDKTIEKFLPQFDYLLIDLSKYSIDEVKHFYKSIALQMSLLVLKYIFSKKELKSHFFRIFEKLPELLKAYEGRDLYTSILAYLFYSSDLETTYVIDNIQKISNKGGEIAMSTAEKLIQQGKQEGIHEGMQKGMQKGRQEGMQKSKKEVAQRMIQEGFSDEVIARITGLNQDELIKLRG